MSGLYVLLLLAIWLGLGYGGYRLWRRWAPQWTQKKGLYAALGLAGAAVWVLWPFYEVAGKKMYYDAQVRELCAKDGGLKVYETVKLPADKFDKYGQINFYRPTQGENALGAEYIFKLDIQYLRTGDPTLQRFSVRVTRRIDGKRLGETASYARAGGDLPGPWHPSSFVCPADASEVTLLKSIFIKATKE